MKNILTKIGLGGLFFAALIILNGCEEKKENPVTLQPLQTEWTCEGCHTNQAQLALLADYIVGGGEAGEG